MALQHLVCIAVLGASLVASAAATSSTKAWVDADRLHWVQHDLELAVPQAHILDLDGITPGCAYIPVGVKCDVTKTKLDIIMQWNSDRPCIMAYLNKYVNTEEGVYVTSTKYGCDGDRYLMMRVFDVKLSTSVGRFTVQTSPGYYGELIKRGPMKYYAVPKDAVSRELLQERGITLTDELATGLGLSAEGDLAAEFGGKICIGVNTGYSQDCDRAAKPFPIFNYTGIKVDCSNCYAGFYTEWFSEFEWEDFKVSKFSAGFRNMGMSAAVQLDMDSSTASSVLGVDKDVWSWETTLGDTLFALLGVPFSIKIAAKAHMKSILKCDAATAARVGMEVHHEIGDDYMTWTRGGSWQHVKGTPKTTVTPTIQGEAEFNCKGDITFSPSVNVEMGNLMGFKTSLDPRASLEVTLNEDKKQICETASVEAKFQSYAFLHMNALWGLLEVESEWGPNEWKFSKAQGQEKCSNILERCSALKFSYCCNFGTPCDCSRSKFARGQCGATSYDGCCGGGAACHCSPTSAKHSLLV